MKSYLSTLLLFLLLVHVSSSISLPFFRIPPKAKAKIFKEIGKEVSEEGVNYIWEKTIESINNNTDTPPPPRFNAQPVKRIKGLNLLKEYFSYFGYLQNSGPFNDDLDQDTISAIKSYQQYFNLQVTGRLNNETFMQILLPRCGVPDMNFDYNLTNNQVSWPKAGNRWFPKANRNLTYGFLPASEVPDEAMKVFKDAFTRWSEATGVLNFTETTYDEANIKVGFYNFSDKIEDIVVGGSIIRLQQGSNVVTAEIRLDGTKYWVLPTENGTSWHRGEFDLEAVVMHQIGHLLGLDHSSEEESIMYPTIIPSQQRKVQLSDYDKNNIQQLYTNSNSANGGCLTMFGSIWQLLTTLSLAFSCIVFMC